MDDVAVKLTLLGRFELRVGDVAALDRTFSRRRALALLKLLALQPGRSLHREQVYAALWPDLPSDAGANNLRQTCIISAALSNVSATIKPVFFITTMLPSATGSETIPKDRFALSEVRRNHGSTA